MPLAGSFADFVKIPKKIGPSGPISHCRPSPGFIALDFSILLKELKEQFLTSFSYKDFIKNSYQVL